MPTEQLDVRQAGEALSGLRLRSEATLREIERSLRRDGQLTPVLCVRTADRLEIADGFKRLYAARALGWERLKAEVKETDAAGAKLLMWHGNRVAGLSDVEQAWVVRSLYRKDELTQVHIARLLSHDKSWVSRRVMLAEALSTEVEGWLRLGLISATAARELWRLPRGNQAETAQVVMKRGLTTRQTARLVDELVAARDSGTRDGILAATRVGNADGKRSRTMSPGEALVAEIARMRQVGARLVARLMERSLGSLGEPAATEARASLGELHRQLVVLTLTIAKARGEDGNG